MSNNSIKNFILPLIANQTYEPLPFGSRKI